MSHGEFRTVRALHDEFRTVKVAYDPFGWQGSSWSAECKGCNWIGPPRRHPLDCGADSVMHSEAVGARLSASDWLDALSCLQKVSRP